MKNDDFLHLFYDENSVVKLCNLSLVYQAILFIAGTQLVIKKNTFLLLLLHFGISINSTGLSLCLWNVVRNHIAIQKCAVG